MTSEPDSKTGRRPPTIELKATEVDQPAAAGQSGGAAAADQQPATKDPPPQKASAPRAPGRLKSHIAGGIVGAIIVAAIGAGLWLAGLVPLHRAALSPDAAPNGVTIDAIAARLNDIQSELRAQPAKFLPAQSLPAQSPPSDATIVTRIAAVDAETKSLGETLAALNRRLDDIAAASQSAAKQANAAQAAAEAAKSASQSASESARESASEIASEIASQSAKQAASQAASQTDVQRGDLDALSRRIAALESAVNKLAENAAHSAPGTNDQAARLTVAAAALRAAVDRGQPYQAELAAVQSLGAAPDAISPLESFATTGVPSAAALSHDLAMLAPALQRATTTSSGATGLFDRLAANARHLVRITPVDAPTGNDPSAVIARIEIDADHADVAAALDDVAALPDSAKPLAAGWLKKAKAREAAVAASRQIAATALAGLSKPASQ